MVLAKSTTDDLEVQARSVPAGRLDTGAVNQQSPPGSTGTGSPFRSRTGRSWPASTAPRSSDEKIQVGTGRVERLGTQAGVAVRASSGPTAPPCKVTQLALFGLNATVVPAAARQGKLVGLLGNDDGKATNDLGLADGTSLGIHTEPGRHPRRVRRLVAGDPGQLAVRLRAGPDHRHLHRQVLPDEPAHGRQRRGQGDGHQAVPGRRASPTPTCCSRASWTPRPPAEPRWCWATTPTPRPSTPSHYAHQAHGIQARRARRAPRPTTAVRPVADRAPRDPAAALRTIVDSGRINSPKEDATFDFPAKKGDMIWIGPPGCDNQLIVALKDPSGKVLDANDVQHGAARLPDRSVRPDRHRAPITWWPTPTTREPAPTASPSASSRPTW